MTHTSHTDIDLFSLNAEELAQELGWTNSELAESQAVLDGVRLFAHRIKAMRNARNMSRAELGNRIGVSEQRIAQLESGTLRNAPNIKSFTTIAHVLGYNFELLTSPVEDSAPVSKLDTEAELNELRAEVGELLASLKKRNSAFHELRLRYERLAAKHIKLMKTIGRRSNFRNTTSSMTSRAAFAMKKN